MLFILIVGMRAQTKFSIAAAVAFGVVLAALFWWPHPNSTLAPAEPVAAPTPIENSNVNAMVSQVARNFSRSQIGKSEEEIQHQAKQLPANDLENLKKRVLSTGENGNDRSAAMYLLTQAGPAARNELTEVAGTPLPPLEKTEDPHSAGSLQKTFEISLRIRALEALDKMGVQDPSVARNFAKIQESQTDPTLRFLVQVCQQGLQQGRPGKLTRFIDKALDERGRPPADH